MCIRDRRYTTEVVAANIQFIGGNANASNERDSNANAGAQNNTQANGSSNFMNQEYEVPVDSNFTSDDIPF